ncbi:MAG: FliH/SctL family protein [Candidatus Krumholzibacteria bacterium]|nr:FliH/SctL family protein [Candidatus Krumholzibacteria bacterium]
MLKWSPEPFDLAAEDGRSPLVSSDDFQSTGVGASHCADGNSVREFRREAGFNDTKALMNALTPDERSQVYELVELDLAEEYRAREQELTAEFDTRVAAIRTENEEFMAGWTERLAGAMAVQLNEAASASARLAVQMAEKIVRQAVKVDPEVIARVVETTLFKISESSPLTLRTSPEDASWLEGQSALLARLHIGNVVADRRVDRGGCMVQSEGREWDATLDRQLETLAEIVSEMIGTAVPDPSVLTSQTVGPVPAETTTPDVGPSSESEVDDVPGVE